MAQHGVLKPAAAHPCPPEIRPPFTSTRNAAKFRPGISPNV
jgi:hypothetical protein